MAPQHNFDQNLRSQSVSSNTARDSLQLLLDSSWGQLLRAAIIIDKMCVRKASSNFSVHTEYFSQFFYQLRLLWCECCRTMSKFWTFFSQSSESFISCRLQNCTFLLFLFIFSTKPFIRKANICNAKSLLAPRYVWLKREISQSVLTQRKNLRSDSFTPFALKNFTFFWFFC